MDIRTDQCKGYWDNRLCSAHAHDGPRGGPHPRRGIQEGWIGYCHQIGKWWRHDVIGSNVTSRKMGGHANGPKWQNGPQMDKQMQYPNTLCKKTKQNGRPHLDPP